VPWESSVWPSTHSTGCMQPVPPELLAVETSNGIHLAHSASADGVHLRVLHSKLPGINRVHPYGK
jgi:hypothetical protein